MAKFDTIYIRELKELKEKIKELKEKIKELETKTNKQEICLKVVKE